MNMQENFSPYFSSYESFVPVQIEFGLNKINLLETILQQQSDLNKKKVFIVSQSFFLQNKDFVLLCEKLKNKLNIEIIIPKTFPATTDWVNQQWNLLRKNREIIDTFVGVGGGSIMDATKALCLCVSEDKPVEVLLDNAADIKRIYKLILVPTISGSGSEVSKGAVMINNKTGLRVNLKTTEAFADIAIIDPELSSSISWDSFRVSLFDVISHTFETYVSKKSTSLTKEMSFLVLKDIFSNEQIFLNTQNKEGTINSIALEFASFYSTLMGMNLALSTTCLPHRLSYAIPLEFQSKIKHAEAVAIFYPGWLDLLTNKQSELIAELDNELGFSTVEKLLFFRERLEVGLSLSEAGISVDEKALAEIAMKTTGNLTDDPSYKDIEDVLYILRYNS